MEILTIYNSQEDFELGNVLRIVPFRICHHRSFINYSDCCHKDKSKFSRHAATLMLPNGGVTQMIYVSEDGNINIINAHCSVNDYFSRPKGIKTCFDKLVRRLYTDVKIVSLYRPNNLDNDFAIVLGPINDDIE